LKLEVPGFRQAMLELSLDNLGEELQVALQDHYGRRLVLFVMVSNSQAGLQASFFVKNLIIDNSMANLLFFYDNSVKMPTLNSTIKEIHKLQGLQPQVVNQSLAQIMPTRLQQSMVAGISLF